MEGGRLIHVTVDEKEAAHGGGNLHDVPRPPVGGGVVHGGVQVRPLGFEPSGRLPEGGQVGSIGRWLAGG